MTNEAILRMGAILCVEVTRDRAAILYAERSAPVNPADSGWQFLYGNGREDPNLALWWAVFEVLELDPTFALSSFRPAPSLNGPVRTRNGPSSGSVGRKGERREARRKKRRARTEEESRPGRRWCSKRRGHFLSFPVPKRIGSPCLLTMLGSAPGFTPSGWLPAVPHRRRVALPISQSPTIADRPIISIEPI